jgi:transcriptional regulator with XRE-family HTH domain
LPIVASLEEVEAQPIGDVVMDWAHLGRCIERDRKRRRWLQADLAEAAGLTRRTIGNYENGRGRDDSSDIPAGYYAVAEALGWPDGAVERALAGEEPTAVPTATEEARPRGRTATPLPTPAELYPAVVAFGRACVRAGADPGLRDALEEAAEQLLASAAASAPAQAAYGLAAYRPHGWSEGEPGVPGDDAERIQEALRAYREGRT